MTYMKIIKWMISLILFALCFATGSELFQSHVSHFTGGLLYTYLIDVTPASYAAVREACDREDTGAFLMKYTADSIDCGECHIYATTKAAEVLCSGMDIRSGTYKSLLSGKCEIIFHDFAELEQSGQITGNRPIYFLGDESSIRATGKEINRDEKIISMLEKDKGGITGVIYAVWGSSMAFLLLLTWICIQFDRKKDFIRISMGQPRLKIMITGMAMDTVAYILAFILPSSVLSRIIYLSYRRGEIMLLFIVFIILNSLLYISIYEFSHKEIIYGANINQRLLSCCYVLKLVMSTAAIAGISLFVMLLAGNGRYLAMYDDINVFRDYYQLTFELEGEGSEDLRRLQMETMGRFFMDRYCDNTLALAAALTWTEDGEGHYQPLLILNRASQPLIHQDSMKDLIKDKDFYLFIPRTEGTLFPDDEIGNFIYYTFGITEDRYSFEKVFYDDPVEILFFDLDNLFYLEYGFEKAVQPTFLYANISGEKLKEIGPPYPPYPIEGMTLMYRISEDDLELYRDTYGFRTLERISVVNTCNKHKALFLRNILLSGTTSGLLLFLSAVIIMVLSRLEYTINARLLSVRKMLGYSVVRKSAAMLLLNMIAIMISVAVNVMISILTGLFRWSLPLICGGVLLAAEFMLMVVVMSWFERKDSIKLLKGGLL